LAEDQEVAAALAGVDSDDLLAALDELVRV
jgi:hypothetical protein